MLHIRCILFILIIAAYLPALAQRTQTIRSTQTKVNVETVADTSLVFLFPVLKEARLFFKDGKTSEARLNYSIINDKMQIQTHRGILPLETDQLESVVVEGSTFIYHKEGGYMEVLSEGSIPLFMKREIKVSVLPVRRGAYGGTDHTSAIDVVSSITTTTGDHGQTIYLENPGGQEMDITLRYNEYFTIEKDGRKIRINNARQLQRDLPEYRNELRDFLRRENINFSSRRDLVKLVKFMEGLN
jgi:phage tail sheath protein FI